MFEGLKGNGSNRTNSVYQLGSINRLNENLAGVLIVVQILITKRKVLTGYF